MHCGVIGLGFMGTSRVSALKQVPGVSRISGVDPVAGRAAELLGPDQDAGTFEALLHRDLDALFVCTPDGLHTGYAVQALERGVATFVEKPLATTVEDCARIAAAENDSSASVTVGQTVRFNSRYAAVRRHLADGRAGRVLNLATRRNWPLSEGLRMAPSTDLAMYLGTHEADVVHWLTGERVTSVYAAAAPIDELPLKQAPTVLVLATLEGGAIATIELSWAVPDTAGLGGSDANLQVMGTRGVVRATCPDVDVVALGDPARAPERGLPEDHPGTIINLGPTYPDGLHTDEVVLETRAFVDRLASGRPPTVTSAEGAAAVSVAVAIQESIATGQPVTVRHLTEGAVTR